MSDYADTIRSAMRRMADDDQPAYQEALAALDSLLVDLDGLYGQLEAEKHNHRKDNEYLLTENKRLREALRISYPATPVDCLVSELRDEFGLFGQGGLTRERFEERVAQVNLDFAARVEEDDDGTPQPGDNTVLGR